MRILRLVHFPLTSNLIGACQFPLFSTTISPPYPQSATPSPVLKLVPPALQSCFSTVFSSTP
nr:MAG TPA: hypothetical protein [Caudoviricetes sp.]